MNSNYDSERTENHNEGRTSVVIPCYKDDRFLRTTLDSVADQTAQVCEVIVVDDGSPNPLQQPEDWEGPPLRWIRTENQGLGAARNVGLHAARGEFVAFCDADDHWQPTKIEKQEDCLDKHADAVACYTWCVEAEGYFPFGPYPDPELPRDQLAAKIWYGQFFPPSSVLVRRNDALAVEGFREGLRNGEDLDMWFRLFERGEIFGVPEPLCWYRTHDGQITSNEVRKILGAKESRRQIIEKYSERLIQGGIKETELWNAYRDEIFCVYYRRRMESARPMLWDYWRDHKTDLRALKYLVLSHLPGSVVEMVRGRI